MQDVSATELDEQGYQRALSSGSEEQIRSFVQRVIFVRGGTVKSVVDLERFARDCQAEVCSFAALLAELDYASWVIWPASPEVASAANEEVPASGCTGTAAAAAAASAGSPNNGRAEQDPSAAEEENFQRALASASAETMSTFIRRAVFILGGSVKSEHDLDDFARETASAASGAPRSYSALVHELRLCSWVIWPASTTTAESSVGRPASSVPEAATGCSGSCSSSSSCGVQENASTAPGAPSSSSSQAPPCLLHGEVRLDDSTQIWSKPVDDLGALAVFTPAMGFRALFSARTFLLVLRNPTQPTRGLVLLQGPDRAAMVATGRQVAEALGVAGGGGVDPEVYVALTQDSELRSAVLPSIASAPAPAGIAQQQPGGLSSFGSGGGQGPPATAPSNGTAGRPSEAASSSSGSPPTAAAAAAAAGAADDGAIGECPICFCEISQEDAAMRCSGEGGRHHYFHSACMRQWVEQCRTGRSGPSCPICRCRLEFHAQRLDDFLRGPQAEGLDAEDRSFLQACADRLRQAGSAWGDVCTLENAKKGAGLVACGGVGFMMGYNNTHPGLQQVLSTATHDLPQEHRMAQNVGYFVGLVARVLRDVQLKERRERERREEEERRRRRH
eukprot:gnl/TRDRNA2_/TRDRNA2_151110_c2_seq2.p1 gnl/TRDRNA2_/TRDRNA2_151110_c2~~gnl/TRDRNA2_/TRDRNA2_151110_c2_seq2.p1  ORF type:complete len:619 (+),score=92.50 gnl/TRDRNA2_/TRDRNA2_151110_c2_seq2:79-1935(+)